ncbi:MAG: hypothetical protein K6F88_06625 [Ruminococcus sp.]|nr:hypothetical protein [Ruminococcus sp.]
MSKFCNFCGAKADDNAGFCTECGMKFEEQVQSIQQEQPVQYAQPAQQHTPPVQQPYQPQQNYNQPAPQQYAQNQNYYAQPVQAAVQASRQKKPGKGFGIASLVLGIFAAVIAGIMLLIDFIAVSIDVEGFTDGEYATFGLSFAIIFFVVIVGILALLSLIFGLVSLIKGNKGTAIAGLVLSVLAIAACVLSVITATNLKKPTLNEMIKKGTSYNSSSLQSSLDELEDLFDNYN